MKLPSAWIVLSGGIKAQLTFKEQQRGEITLIDRLEPDLNLAGDLARCRSGSIGSFATNCSGSKSRPVEISNLRLLEGFFSTSCGSMTSPFGAAGSAVAALTPEALTGQSVRMIQRRFSGWTPCGNAEAGEIRSETPTQRLAGCLILRISRDQMCGRPFDAGGRQVEVPDVVGGVVGDPKVVVGPQPDLIDPGGAFSPAARAPWLATV